MTQLGQMHARPQRPLRAVAIVLLAISCQALAGWGDGGFRPLYGAAGIGAQANEKLAQIEINHIPGRVGQVIRNDLIFQTTGGGAPVPPAYRLDIAIREGVSSTLVRLDGDAQSQVYNLDAAFKLTRLSDNQVVLKGTSFGRAGMERFRSIFSNVRAREDAENRAARTVSEDLKSRLAGYLAGVT